MSATNTSVPHYQHAPLEGAGFFVFWTLIFAFLPIVVLFGGTRYLVLALAMGLAIISWTKPRESAGAAILFLFATGIVLPYGARLDVTGPQWQMEYWAVGLLLITLAAILRLGLRRTASVPRSAKALVAASLLAALYGVSHGVPMGYVLRELYGVLLLVAYVAIGMHMADLGVLTKRIASFGVICAVCFFIYYLAVFPEYGFHKEAGFIGEQACFLAIILFVAGAERKKWSWSVAAIMLLIVPALVFMRRDILTFLFALVVAIAMKARSKVWVGICCLAMLLVTLPVLYPPITEVVATELRETPVIGRLLPPGVRGAGTLVDRFVQLESTLQTVRAHPWFGAGMGGDLQMVDPGTGELYIGAYEDNGWGYLLQKMGIVGAAAFLWFLAAILRASSRQSVALSACLIAATVVTMFTEPVFLHFTTSPVLGTFAGLLLANQRRRHLLTAKAVAEVAPSST